MPLARLAWPAAVLLCVTPAAAQAPADRALAAEVDSFVRRIMAVSGTAGVAVAVVHGEHPVLVKGYGFADLERRIPVSEHTAFYIASTTKAFTALTLALMADRKTVDLDAPITRYLTGAHWAPDVNPDSITLRQLLSHSHGLAGNGPIIWRTAFTGVHTNTLLKDLLRHHGASDAGRAYRYTNLGYNIAGLIIDEVTGGKWQDALATNVFTPLGMSRTTAYVSRIDSAQRAMPYVMEPTGPRRVHYAKSDGNMQAAGGLVSTASDLARWLEVQLTLGRLGGRQVFPRPVIAETQRQQVAMTGTRGEQQTVGYGLGWVIGVQGADTALFHGGGFSAFRTIIAFDRRHRIGVAAVTNEGSIGGGAIEAIAQYVLDRARDGAAARAKYAQRLTELPAMLDGIRTRIAEDRTRRAARPQTLSKPLEAYAGTYESPEGGVMTWTVRDARLWAEIGVLRSVAEVFDHQTDRLRVELEPGSGEVVHFKFAGDRAASLVHQNREYVRRAAPGQDPLSGTWEGQWSRAGDTMAVTMVVRRDTATARYTATFDADRLRASGIPFNAVEVRGCCDVTLVLRGDRTTARFVGTLRGDSLIGVFEEGETEGRFRYVRAADARSAVEEREITFSNGDVTLAGSLLLPPAGDALPAVVFLHGSGAEGRWASRFLGTHLAMHGIAALIFDKRGVGKSTGDWRRAGIDELAGDGVAAVARLLEEPRIARGRIGIHGHSQGGTLAPLVAVRSPSVAFVIGSAAAGVPLDSVEIFSILNSVLPNARSAPDSLSARRYVGELVAVAYHGRSRQALDSLVPLLRDRPWFFEPPPAADGYWSFSRSFGQFRPLDWWARVRVPVLLMYGAEDQRVPAAASAGRIVAALGGARNRSVSVRIFPNADHSFRLPPAASGWPVTAPGYVPGLLEWLAKR